MTKPSILIVDRSEDSREVLRTALERKGMRILEADRTDQALQLAKQHHPRVIVLDLDVETEPCDAICGQFAEQLPDAPASMVVLGTARIAADPTGGAKSNSEVAGDGSSTLRQFVAKPYHYGPLIRRIEELVA